MVEKFVIGIDLGTSTSEICVYRNNEPYVIPDPSSPGRTPSPILPSIVAINRRGDLVVGNDALPYIILDDMKDGREVKRKMGTGTSVKLGTREFRPEEISALILKKLKQNAEEALGLCIRDVVLSVPANFSDAARQATMNAGELAGLNIVRLINEPTAAALAFGIKNMEAEEQILVFDFGGGTLDITALEMMSGVIGVKCSFGDPTLGGKEFDEALMKVILGRFAADHPGIQVSERAGSQLKDAAEKAKIALSRDPSATVTLINFGVLGTELVDLDLEVTRTEFEEAVSPLLERARACVREALDAKNLRPSSINRVLLVGGTTYIPCVRRLVAELFGKEPKADVSPDLAVAIGAAVQAALAMGVISEEKGIILTDVSPFGLGIDVVNNVGGRPMLMYDPLIMRNTTIPYSTKRVYSLMRFDQENVEIRVYQDHTGAARFPSDAVDTGIFGLIPDIPAAEDGTPHPIEVEFSYDISGMAKLLARIPTTGQRVEVVFENSPTRMNDREMTDAKRRVQDLLQQNPKAKRYEALIQKAQRIAETADASGKRRLSLAVSDLQRALDAESEDGIKEAGDGLTDLLFDLENDMAG